MKLNDATMQCDQNQGASLFGNESAGATAAGGRVILVHGTWGRGFFGRGGVNGWFEDGSSFRTELDGALNTISPGWSVRSFLWSGANSVHARDRAARKLAEELERDLKDNAARIVIIAHSHGGNLALRALHLLGSEGDRIRVVTLATPFLRVLARSATISRRGIQFAFGALWFSAWLLVLVGPFILLQTKSTPILFVIIIGTQGLAYFIVRTLMKLFTNTERAIALERAASYDTSGFWGPRLLVIRGFDDEATLTLAAGAIAARLSSLVQKIAPYAVFLGVFAPAFFVIVVLGFQKIGILGDFHMRGQFNWYGPLLVILFVFGNFILFLPGLFKSVFGREFFISGIDLTGFF